MIASLCILLHSIRGINMGILVDFELHSSLTLKNSVLMWSNQMLI